ncbi:myb-binding protein 1A [Drosophila montana]|uniref:myb-binding protein 1A n=1 Tax=Drosophila montana TaxID=40370 RepID=UPI00313D233F
MGKKKPEAANKAVQPQMPVKKHQVQKENQNHNEQQSSQPPRTKTQKKPKEKAKRPQNGTVEEINKVPAKKRKLSDKQNGDGDQIESEDGAQVEKKVDTSKINKGIFAIFNKLQDTNKQNTQKHVNEMIALLTNEAIAEKRTATCAYALKRLVRCTGADDKEAVALNSSYINSILRDVPGLDPIELINVLKRELHASSQQKGKEETLAAVGQLITVLAIMQSQYFQQPKAELISVVYPILIAQLKGREYLVSLCADIMADSFKQVSLANFQSHVWPLLQPELNKPITAQKLHGCDLLLSVHLNYPKLLPLRQLQTILWRKQTQFEQLFDTYLNNATMQGDGLYARLGKFLATCSSEQVLAAWQQHVAEHLPFKHVTAKSYIIQTLSHVLMHYDDSSRTDMQLEQLFTLEPLVSMLLAELTAAKKLNSKANAKAKAAQRQLRYICRKFETALLVSFQQQLKQDACKLGILRPMLQLQLQLDNIVQTPRFTQQLLAQLGEQGLEQMYEFYSEQFTSNNELLTRTNREHCLKQMQQLQNSRRNKQLEFLLFASLFHLDDQRKPCTADEAAVFSRQAASRCEETLFSCLVNKIGTNTEQLVALNEQLRPLLGQLAKKLTKPGIEGKLRIKVTPEMRLMWEKVQKVMNAPAKEKQALAVIFDALIMFLGLAMFTPSCNVALDLIDDLFICKQNALKTKQGKDKQRKSAAEPEPNWQEVLTDVLLQLLLQTGHFWRLFVNAIGGALMPHLNKRNLEQFLELLDMDKNPLDDKVWDVNEGGDDQDDEDDATSNDEESDEADTEDDDAEDVDKSDEEDDEDDADEDDDDEDDEDDEDEDEDDGDEDEDDEATNLARIREGVRQALLSNENDDVDSSSIDWNDVGEEEGERLNQALERAFHIRKPKGGKGKNAKRQTKSERITDTALLHLRIRVLDLVELFIGAQPQLEIILNALLSIQKLYRISSADSKLQPLAEASKKALRKLLAQKISYQSPDQDKQPIIDCIRQLLEQDEAQPPLVGPLRQPPKAKGDYVVWRNKCIAYLVSQFNEPNVTASDVWPLLQSFAQDWASRRNSPYQLATFDAIFGSPWIGIGRYAASFYALLSMNLRLFRRVQILELLLKHCRRICNTLTNKLQTTREFHGILTKYEPVADKDRSLQKKLLAQLQKVLTEAEDSA